jgi:Calx-beta domain
VRRYLRRDKELRRLEDELSTARHEAPTDFIRKIVARERGEPQWLAPRLRIGAAVAIIALALAAMASAGGLNVITQTTRTAVEVIKRSTSTSAPQVVNANPANKQYKNHCGTPPTTPKCHITIFDANVKEGNTGTMTSMVFTVSLDAIPDAPVSVSYSTRDFSGTATFGTSCTTGVDYIRTAGTLTFPAGTDSKTFTVTVCGDKLKEGNETFLVDLTAQSPNADIVRTPATGTIVDDDRS